MKYWLLSHDMSILLAVYSFFLSLLSCCVVLPSSHVCALGLGPCQYSHLLYFFFFFLTQKLMKLWEQKIKALNLLVYLLTQCHFPLSHMFLFASQAVSSSPSLVCVVLFSSLSQTVFQLSALAISAPFLLIFNFPFLIPALFTLSSLRHLPSVPSAPSPSIPVQPN